MASSPPSSLAEQVTSSAAAVATYLRLPVLASSGIAALLSGLLYFKQNEIIYQRNMPPTARSDVPRPPQFDIPFYEDLSIPTPDGESLSAFYIRAPKTPLFRNITVLMFHGNAGNIGHRIPIAKVFQQSLGCNVLMLEYRGYGLSTGTPDEQGLVLDAQTALEYLLQRADTRDTRVVVYGQSLGGAVGVQLVARNQKYNEVSGLILENTFTSMRKLIPSAIPPARYLARLCHQVWPTDDTIPTIKEVPILFLSGLEDEIVPSIHMKQLYDLCKSKNKIWAPLPKGTHNESVCEPGYFQYIDDFLENDVLRKS